MATTATKRERPFGVKAIIVLHLFSALLPLVAFFVLGDPGISRILKTYVYIPLFLPASNQALLEKGVLLGITLFQVVLVAGLWQMRSWAWLLVMIFTGLGMTMQIWRYFQGFPDYLGMVVNVLVVFYLNQREVQEAFRQEKEAAA